MPSIQTSAAQGGLHAITGGLGGLGLRAAAMLIANDAPLGPEWLDHPLKGEWSDHRECHIGGDFLLIYAIEGNLVNFVRAGTHSELFE